MQAVRQILEMNQQKICSGSPVTQKESRDNLIKKPNAMSSLSNDANNQSKRIDLMFTRFAAFYGHVWRSQFKDENFFGFAKKQWQEGLTNFSDEILDKAIVHCRETYEMPPTLPQVIILCRQIKKRIEFYVPSTDYNPAKVEVVLHHLRQCKDILIKQ